MSKVDYSRRRIRRVAKRVKCRMGHMVWVIHWGILLGLRWEKECNLNTARGRKEFVDRRTRTQEIYEKFDWIDFSDERKPYVTDPLKEALVAATIYMFEGRTPKGGDNGKARAKSSSK